MKKIILGLTGASGSAYFLRIGELLSQQELELYLIASHHGEQVLEYETGTSIKELAQAWDKNFANVTLEDNENLFSAAASGSSRFDAMAIVPCSMSTLAMLAHGITETLLTRAADVMLKEHHKLVLVPRETPLTAVHLKNMTELAQLGATILPAMPGFYNKPQTLQEVIDFVAGKTLDSLGIENSCYPRWKGEL